MNEFANNVKVEAYSGYKANERPINFTIDGFKVEITKVMESWVEPNRDFFSVKGDDGKIYTLYWDRENDLWFVSPQVQDN